MAPRLLSRLFFFVALLSGAAVSAGPSTVEEAARSDHSEGSARDRTGFRDGRDPDQRDYVVSNARILSTGYTTDWTLDAGIQELMKAYRIVRRTEHANF